ncbi:hypothetical protein JAAARDRAFT_205592 [Jaapia argillacea MUCL 33604]|uniref:Uncharacterized protein n=1 Tax=Jaapia argillacea MUCL 33604 TaxID=933084 RepID=A0A067QAE3_9AGAM|nr:hypothetical protein JAAARDRAFT_205592 [Jaapia argillacea MUCL 33604]
MTDTANAEAVRARAAACQAIVDDCVAGKFPIGDALTKLQAAGATPSEGEGHIRQIEALIAQSKAPQEPPAGEEESVPTRESTPDGLERDELAAFRRRRDDAEATAELRAAELKQRAIEKAAWEVLRLRALNAQSSADDQNQLDSSSFSRFLDLSMPFGTRTSNVTAAIVAGAPHLADLVVVSGDEHIRETWKLRQHYSKDKILDGVVDLMQQLQLSEPIPRSLWRDIIQERYVNFEKLHASMDPGYDHRDEPKDFHGGFALVKKDQASAKKALTSEGHWIRVFGAWAVAVGTLYPHRIKELDVYRGIVMELFHASPANIQLAIRFDADVRDRYSKNPFHMDDRNRVQVALFTQMCASPSSPFIGQKRASSFTPGPSKRAAQVCDNWNNGVCVEPCRAKLHSKLVAERELATVLGQAVVAAEGPKTLSSSPRPPKRKAFEFTDVPSFHRGFAWGSSSPNNISPAALYTESAPPLPSPPQHLLDDPIIKFALKQNKHHMKVETPFDISAFEGLLSDHPNPLFVQSVIHGLRHGFYPFDDGEWKVELDDPSDNFSVSEDDLAAIRAYRDQEVAAGHWSGPIGKLLPGMKISPMFVNWRNDKPRIITDHSASGLNDGIPIQDGKVRYDDMRDFGACLHHARKENPDVPLVLFKSDVASAFLNLLAHPLWQLRQVVMVDGALQIVHQLVFGNRASPRIWCAVSGLLCWLGVRKLKIYGLHIYMDDFFGWDYAGNFIWFHGSYRPGGQQTR